MTDHQIIGLKRLLKLLMEIDQQKLEAGEDGQFVVTLLEIKRLEIAYQFWYSPTV